MKLRKSTAGLAALALTGGVLVTSPFTSASADGGNTVGLHNTTAGFEPCPEGITNAWHFVAPPVAATAFLEVTLDLAGAGAPMTLDFVSVPSPGHAYVTVPPGYTFDSLMGGSFLITGSNKDVRLSHLCGGGTDETPPAISVSKTAEVTKVVEYDWSIVKNLVGATGYTSSADLDYEVIVTKTGPTMVPGSYLVTGVITVTNLDPVKGALLIDVEDSLPGATCSLDDEFEESVLAGSAVLTFAYTCTDISDDAYGYGTNTATATLVYNNEEFSSSGTAQVYFDSAEIRETLDDSATVSDDKYGDLGEISESTTFEYTIPGVPAGGENCYPGFVNTATVMEGDSGDTDSDDATAKLCYTKGGHTIGYWFASPAGGKATAAAFGTLKDTYGSVLNGLTLNTQKAVKDFGQKANCSGTCTSMLQAQFIATAMSVLKNGTGSQCVYLPNGTQTTIAGLLQKINAEWDSLSTAQRVEYKDLLDAINNNTALACVVI